MIREISLQETYIPKALGNRDLEPTEQCRVLFKTPTVELRSKASKSNRVEYRMNAAGKFEETALIADLDINYVAGQLLLDRIENEGYKTSEGKVKKIERWTDLLLAPPQYHELLKEICEEADRRLKDKDSVDEKNSE